MQLVLCPFSSQVTSTPHNLNGDQMHFTNTQIIICEKVKTLTCSETCKTAARFPRKTCRAFPTCVPPTFHQAGLFHSLVDRAGICEEDCRRVRDRRDWMAKLQLLLLCWTRGRGQSALRRSVLGHYQGLAVGRGVDTLNIERSLILTSSSANISDCLNFKMNLFSDDNRYRIAVEK